MLSGMKPLTLSAARSAARSGVPVLLTLSLLGCGGQSKPQKSTRASDAAPFPTPSVAAARDSAVKPPAPGGLIFSDGFEAGHLKGWSFRWLRRKASARLVAAPVRHGKGALEISLRRSDPMYSKGKRSELMVPGHYRLGQSYWYGFSIYLPPDWKEDFKGEVVAQWFATRDKHLGERPRSPSLALRIKQRWWFVTSRWDPKPLSVKNTAPKAKVWKGPLARGTWTDWAFHVRWSYKADGLVQVYQNGRLVATRKGPNTYNDRVGPILKIGVYKAPWNKPDAPSAVSSRLLYFDEVRVGGAQVGLKGVSPPAAGPSPSTGPPPPPAREMPKDALKPVGKAPPFGAVYKLLRTADTRDVFVWNLKVF